MKNIKLTIIDNLTYEIAEEVELSIDNLKDIIVLTSDLETTKVMLVTKEEEE